MCHRPLSAGVCRRAIDEVMPAAPAPSLCGLQPQETAGSSVKPQAFKSLVGRGHPEFSSGRQQVRRQRPREGGRRRRPAAAPGHGRQASNRTLLLHVQAGGGLQALLMLPVGSPQPRLLLRAGGPSPDACCPCVPQAGVPARPCHPFVLYRWMRTAGRPGVLWAPAGGDGAGGARRGRAAAGRRRGAHRAPVQVWDRGPHPMRRNRQGELNRTSQPFEVRSLQRARTWVLAAVRSPSAGGLRWVRRLSMLAGPRALAPRSRARWRT
jgi:hypothetical protein